MSRRAISITVAALAACIAIILILVSSREWFTHRAFDRSARRLEARLDTALANKYAKDLRYTLDKFWEFYDRDLVTRNDLNDVMEKMKALREKKDLEDMDVFDFIGYVSRLYTEAMQRRQREMFPE